MAGIAGGGGGSAGGSVGLIDKAETFSESDLSLSHAGTLVEGESVALGGTGLGSKYIAGGINTVSGHANSAGVSFVPDRSLAGITVDIASGVAGFDYLRLISDSQGVVVEVTDASAGDSVTLTHHMTAGSGYRVVLFSTSYTATRSGYGNTSVGPATGMSSLEGFNAGSSSASWNFTHIEALEPNNSGTTYVEWPEPPDIYAWDRALFQLVEDGGSVDVYVETNDGTGWTEVAGPIARGDEIPADPADNVRFRVEFSRADTSSNPALDAIYRRRVV